MKTALLVMLVLATLAGIYLLSRDILARVVIRAARRLAGLKSRQVLIADQSMHYLEGGAGETLVLVHGFGADADNWLLIAGSLRARYRVVAPDLPGFGNSPAPVDGAFDVESQAAKLSAFIDSLGVSRVHLAGNSMGGQIVTVLAVRRPDRVASLALLDPLGVEQEPGVEPSITMQRLSAGGNVLLPADRTAFAQMLGLMFYRRPWAPAVLNRHYEKRWLGQRDLLGKVFKEITERYVALAPLLPAVRAPTLVLWGAEDHILPAAGAEVLAQGLAHCEVVILDQCGHLPMLEKPRETAQHYLRFLDDIAAR